MNALSKGIESFTVQPNPLFGSGIINYEVSEDTYVEISIYNMLGKAVSTLVQSNKSSGKHSIEIDSKNLEKGIYFVRMSAGNNMRTQKLIIQ